jgi:hypothetical protein
MQDGYQGVSSWCMRENEASSMRDDFFRQSEPGATETVSPPPKCVAPGGAGIVPRPE